LFVLLLAVIAGFVPCAWSQTTMGAVSGTVRDPSAAVVPNAAIALTNTATNISQTTNANEVGFYIFPDVAPGSYHLSVQSAGMQKFEGALVVRVAERLVIDPALKPGETLTQVEVKDITPLVSTDNPTVSTTLERERINQLPINGRSLNTMLGNLPGFEGDRLNGIFNDATEWVLDGAVVSDRRWNGAPSSQPPMDAIQEFTVVSNAVSAKYSRPAEIIVTTKSGTNSLHGTAFETLRNNAIGLARARTDYYTKPPYLNRNEYGANAGGPLIIPKVYNGKDKTFWWFGYEGRQSISYSTVSFNVPTPAFVNGDFSGYKDAQGRISAIYDPLSTGAAPNFTRTPFPGNVIPAGRESPLAKYLFSIVPQPTTTANPLADVNYFGAVGSRSPLWYTTGRIDHRFSEKDQVHLTESYNMSSTLYPTTAGGVGQPMLNGVAGMEFDSNQMQAWATTWVHTFSPTFFNETILSFKRNEWFGGEVEGTNWPDKLGLPNPFGTTRWPQINTLGLGNFAYITNDTKKNHENYIILDDNFTKIKGKHELLFGMHVRRDYLNILAQQRWPAPQLNFDTNATALYDSVNSTPTSPAAVPFTGANLANFYLGYARYANTLGHNWFYLRDAEYSPYFQDNWKLTSRLTLNLGLRWEHWAPYHEKNGDNIGFSRQQDAVVLSAPLDTFYKFNYTYPSLVNQFQSMGIKFISTQQAGLPEDQVHSRWKNFSPRAGFAYKALSGKSSFVIRGGYSMSYFNVSLYEWLDNVRGNFPLAASYSFNPNDATQTPDGIGSYWLRSTPNVIAGVNSANIVNLAQASGITPGCCSMFYFNPDQPDTHTHTWNLTIEKEVAANTVARARYLGSHTSNLYQFYSYNDSTPSYIWYATTGQPLPTGINANIATRFYDNTLGMGSIREYMHTGWANTNGIELQVEQRFARGYAFQLSYDLLNAFASTGSGGGAAGTITELNQYLPGAVPASYDARNRFLNYQRDTNVPKHRVKWNGLIDLPFGKGKKFGGNASGLLDKFIGGWQLAGVGSLRSTYFSLPTGNWNFTGEPIHNYGYQYPIQNCTSGLCVPGYLWWNGYIPANQINSHDANGKPNGYEGVPANYKPAVTPLIPWGSTTMPANAPAGTNVSTYWDTNTVWIPLKNGTVVRTTYNPNLNPFVNQWVPSVLQWSQDASLFKVIPINERIHIRFNADFFNVFNHPGNPNTVNADGMEVIRSSGNSPRTLQLSLRVTF
jgi:hypothetical protein